MFSNPLGQMFGKPDEQEKKKKRSKRNKKLSPEASEDAPSSLNGSNTDLKASVTFEEVQGDVGEPAKCSGLLDIVNEINSAPLVEEPVEEITDEPTETQYEERPVDEITIKAVLEGMQSQNEQHANEPVVQDCWETMLATPPNEEAAWESEVAAAPQSTDSVWEQMLSTPEPQVVEEPVTEVAAEVVPEVVPAVKEQFRLSDATYELVREFYDEQKDSTELGLLKNDLLKLLLNNARSTRSELQDVTEEDIDRALKTIDTDSDDKVNFDEFVQLLSLFFSSKNNLKQRITGVLINQATTHEKLGSLTSTEARSFTNFLHNFFGKQDNETAKNRENFLQRLLKKVLKKKEKKPEENDVNEIDYSSFTNEAAEELQDLCFVKFRE